MNQYYIMAVSDPANGNVVITHSIPLAKKYKSNHMYNSATIVSKCLWYCSVGLIVYNSS